ncbi:hypothetical protein IFR04_001810 [Cadophora malorum]|uniref:Uncharacterized protein n=1 Tax=Cadophora malorum TaxID=108018 RepID=A0A8H7WHM1_9HELO|nr:hypothetical protein IFR04_001810 [Cadophora malorum]
MSLVRLIISKATTAAEEMKASNKNFHPQRHQTYSIKSDVDSVHSPSSPPATEDQIDDEPSQLFLNRHRTFCRTCGWGPAKDDITNTHPQPQAMLQMVSDLKKDMQSTDPMKFTQDALDAFKVQWWNCEGEYLEDNVGNACDGLPVFASRDFSPRSGEKMTSTSLSRIRRCMQLSTNCS